MAEKVLSRQELETLLEDARESLDEVLEERALTLGGTGIHLGAERAVFLREEFGAEEERLRSRIAELEGRLKALG